MTPNSARDALIEVIAPVIALRGNDRTWAELPDADRAMYVRLAEHVVDALLTARLPCEECDGQEVVYVPRFNESWMCQSCGGSGFGDLLVLTALDGTCVIPNPVDDATTVLTPFKSQHESVWRFPVPSIPNTEKA